MANKDNSEAAKKIAKAEKEKTAKKTDKKKKNIFKRIFGKKDKQENVVQQNQQVATTNNVLKRLQHLQSDIRERNDSLRQQMEEQADSLQMRNERLNREFIRLIHDFQQTASQQREDRLTLLADMRRQSMLFIRAGQWRHALSGRDRQPVHGGASDAAPCLAGADLPSCGQRA